VVRWWCGGVEVGGVCVLVAFWHISGGSVVSFMKALASIASVISGLFISGEQDIGVFRA